MEDQETRRPETGQDTLPGDGAAAAREPSPGAEGKAPGGPEGDRTEPEGGGEDPRDRLLAEAREEVARLQARERLQEALLRAGALPEAIPLLCRDAQPGDPDPAGTLKARYGFLFRREEEEENPIRPSISPQPQPPHARGRPEESRGDRKASGRARRHEKPLVREGSGEGEVRPGRGVRREPRKTEPSAKQETTLIRR